MGNEPQGGQNFNPQNWTQIPSPHPNLTTLWQNNHNPHIHIEQHLIPTLDSSDLSSQRQLYFQRKNHPYWVAAYYFQQQSSTEICTANTVAHIFIEKIPIKIGWVRGLPMGDMLHAYYQCFQGYKALGRTLGCFRVVSEYIGVNEKGVVKVWAGSHWAQVGAVGSKISQEEMVKSIVQTLSTCEANSQISIKSYLFRNTDSLSFDYALYQLRQYASEYNNGVIPTRLESLCNSVHFEMFLDPLRRSNHQYSPQQPSMANGRSNGRQRDTSLGNVAVAGTGGIEERQESKEAFFSCMNDEQKLKTTKLLTKQQALHLCANHQTPAPTQHHNIPLQPNMQPSPLSNHHVSGYQRYPQPYVDHSLNQHSNLTTYHTMPKSSEVRPLAHTSSKGTLPTQHLPPFLSSPNQQYNPANYPPRQQVQYAPMNQARALNQLPPPISQVTHPLSQHPGMGTYPANQIYSLPPINPPLQPSHRQVDNNHQRRNRPIPQSIIMQLYTSEDKLVGEDLPSLKSLGLIKQAESEVQPPSKSPNFNPPNQTNPPMAPKYPTNLYPQSTNLHSILELSTEHRKSDTLSHASRHSRPELRVEELKKYDYSKIRSKSNGGFMVDADGRTSAQFLRSIREGRSYQGYGLGGQQLYR